MAVGGTGVSVGGTVGITLGRIAVARIVVGSADAIGCCVAKPPNVGSGDPLEIAVGKTTTCVPLLLMVVPQPAMRKTNQNETNPIIICRNVQLWRSLMCIPSSIYPRGV